MKIIEAEYTTSIADARLPNNDTIPEIAVAGRSNVGKSSFINMITARKKLARSSSEPGRTRMINYFKINKGEFFLVDLPGYGFARVSNKEKESWGKIIEFYLSNSKCLKQVLLLVDIRHDPSVLDVQLAEYLDYYKLPYIVIATKADKISKMAVKQSVNKIAKVFSKTPEEIIAVSAETAEGKDKVLAVFDTLLQ